MPRLNPHSSVTAPRRGPGRGRAWSRAALATFALLVVAAPATIADAVPTKAPVNVTVSSAKTWTRTGVIVKTGETITIKASGVVNFGPTSIARMGPAGRPRSSCRGPAAPDTSFTAPGLDCWSLIGQIGANAPFQVGQATTFRATSDGRLRLGVNDNQFQDNRGSWKVTVAVAAAGGGTTPAPVGKSSSDSNALLFVVAGLVLVLLLLALFVLARRRRGKGETVVAAAAAPEAAVVAEDAPVEAVPAAVTTDEPIGELADESLPMFAKTPGPLGTSVAPVEGEVVDVNIFEVEIANGTDLRVGYNYFPEDTDLHWQVRQGSLFAHGRFPTNGGGNMYHYVTLPLGLRLEPAPAAVDVQFTWAIGGVPFRYSVRRDPGL
ncbi:MAG TPA: LecA/PA-IL family lectin [Acidimicrobiia bacterium]|nr:LecA/PA-IL family lectin [Acidimicrobiia bacterium]